MSDNIANMAAEDLIAEELNDSIDKKILENGLHEEPDFSDPEDFVDDISDEGMFPCFLPHI